MPRSFSAFLALATLSASAAVAQNAYQAGPDSPSYSYAQSQAAPIERPNSNSNAGLNSNPNAYATQASAQPTDTQPIGGVWLRTAPGSSVQTVSANANGTEIRVDHGRANVTVRHPEQDAQILVDLPGGQTAITRDGVYTFNADTNTVRVLDGEAQAFPEGRGDDGIQIKEDHQFIFGTGSVHAKDMDRNDARADLIQPDAGGRSGYGYGGGPRESYYGDGGYGYAAYPYYGYPYYPYYAGYGYPYGYGFGYPYGFGLGFGFGGYYGGGGYRGGYGGYRGGYGGYRGGGGGYRGGGGGGGFHPLHR
ncbi:MAG TPA: hypothetical protein VGN16_12330 [Acidobacteriaceae bacterium]|jgi:hypothetical protein